MRWKPHRSLSDTVVGGLMVGDGGACEGLAGRAGGVQRTRGVRVWEGGRWSRRGGQRGGCFSSHIQLP